MALAKSPLKKQSARRAASGVAAFPPASSKSIGAGSIKILKVTKPAVNLAKLPPGSVKVRVKGKAGRPVDLPAFEAGAAKALEQDEILIWPGLAKAGPRAGWLTVEPLVELVRRRVPMTKKVATAVARDLKALLREQMTKQAQAAVATPVAVPALGEVLSTQEAANLAGVSRPFLTARIDAGDIPLHAMVGNQRRVLRADVLAWKEKSRQARGEALKKMGAELDSEIFSD